jgi:hypothetical protein
MLKRFLATAMLAVVGVLPLAAAPAPLPPFKLSPSEYIPVSEIRPGMTGYGLTVFKGVKISRFGVTVVGVMPQADAGRPLVLVMLSGGPITERKANLIQGMSGSPIYINNRLLGAFALGESTGREPLGMVRPIEDMVDAFDPRLPSKPVFASALPASGGLAGFSAEALDPARFKPLPIALVGAGVGARSLNTLNKWLEPYGMRAVAGPGGTSGSEIPSYFPRGVRLEPGSSIAVSLMQGDVDYTAIGTVTYRKGNRILAFGHPFLQIGPAEFPASTAYIHDVFSSIVVSHKYGSPIETVGTIQQDGPFSVGGLLHRLPPMVPLTMQVADENTKRTRNFKVRMVDHPMLTPGLTLSAAQELIDRVRSFPGESMVDVTFKIVPEGYAPITKSNTFFGPSSVSDVALGDVAQALTLLSRNPFEPVRIKSVNVSVRIHSGHDTATVERAWVEKTKVEPGDTLTVQAQVKPYKKPSETRTLRIKIPENVANGPAQVVVFGGATGFGGVTNANAPIVGTSVSSATSVANVRQYIRNFEERERNDELGVRILLPGSAVSVDGEKLSGLPDVLASVMKSTKASNTRLERDDVRYAEKTPYVLAGAQILNITVQKKSALEKSAAPLVIPDATPDSTDAADAVDAAGDTSGDASDGGEMAVMGRALMSLRPLAPEIAPKPAEPVKVDATPKPDEKKADDKKTTDTATKPEVKAGETVTSEPDKSEGPGRVATLWRQSTKAHFETGKLSNATVNSNGNVEVSGRLKPLSETTRPYIWSLLAEPNGSVLAGTGNGGDILRISSFGVAHVLASVGDLGVHALARDAAGNLYAGTGPNGRIMKIGADGKAHKFFETGERFVLALAMAPDGSLYAGTGPEGKLFVVSPDGKGRELVRLPEAHLMSLTVTEDGDVLVGTSPDGLLYRIKPDGTASVLFDAAETTVSAVATDAAGNIFAATAPKGKVYKVHPDGRGEVLLDKAEGDILALAATGDGALYAAGGPAVYHIAADKVVTSLDNEDQNQIVSLALNEDGVLYAGSANTGVVYRVEGSRTGTLISAAHDAGLRAQWGRVEWLGDVPGGSSVRIQTRTGDVAQPDTTWSTWTDPATATASQISSPPARFIQYKATLTAAPDGESPVLRTVSLRYLTDNRPPTVDFTDPKDGDRWSGKKTVKWTGSDPDTDLLTYTLFLSGDNGTTWKTLNTTTSVPKKTEPAKPATPKTDAEKAADAAAKAKLDAKNAETAKLIQTELGQYPKLSPEMQASILSTAKTALAANPAEAGTEKDANSSLSKTTFSWDTEAEKDGVYRLKVVVTDKASNPANPLSNEALSGPVIVANAKPAVSIFERNTKVAGAVVTLLGDARSESMAILRISYKVDDGPWMAAMAVDGVFDSPEEKWKIVTDALDAGEHTITVKASDEVSNSGTAETKVTTE